MPKFMKEGILMQVEAPGGASDPDLCEVRLTPAEYFSLQNQIKKLRQDVANVKEKAEFDIAKVKRNAQKEIKDTSDVFKREMQRLKTEMQELTETETSERLKLVDKYNNMCGLNDNLIRIATERANQKRGITPKKAHDGYLVLSCRQWVEHYDHKLTEAEYADKPDDFRRRHKYPYTEHRTADVWKSIIQTPYDASLPLDQIRVYIEDVDLWDRRILQDIGCATMNANDINGLYRRFRNDAKEEINGMYKWKFSANYKSGFWEVELYTTQSLVVPEHRRPGQISKNTASKHRKN